MHITFRSQGGIGEVAKEMGFGENISLKFSHFDWRDEELGGTVKSWVSKDWKCWPSPRYKPFVLSLLNLIFSIFIKIKISDLLVT